MDPVEAVQKSEAIFIGKYHLQQSTVTVHNVFIKEKKQHQKSQVIHIGKCNWQYSTVTVYNYFNTV